MAQRRTITTQVEDETTRPTRQERWHVGKEIPLVLICAVLMQTAGGIWWMSQLSAKIDAAVGTISEFKVERYTRDDARRDRELMEQKLSAYAKSDLDFDRRVNSLEGRVERVERDSVERYDRRDRGK